MQQRILAGVIVAALLVGGAISAISTGDSFLKFGFWIGDGDKD